MWVFPQYFTDFHTVQHKCLCGWRTEGKQHVPVLPQMSLGSADSPPPIFSSLPISPFFSKFSKSFPPPPPPLHSPLGLFCCATLRCFWGLMQIIINVFYSFLEYTSSWITVSGQELVPSSLNAILSFNALSKVKWKQTARNIAEWVSASHRPWCVLPYGKWVPCSQPQFPFPSNWFNNSICHIRTYVMDRIW